MGFYQLYPLVFSVFLLDFFWDRQTLVIHYCLQVVISKAFDQVELKFEDTDCSIYFLLLVNPWASLVFSDFANFSEVFLQEEKISIKTNQF